MNVLMLAPHPFYQARGTPIAVDLVLKVLSSRGEKVDVVTFPEGEPVHYANVAIYRTPAFRFHRTTIERDMDPHNFSSSRYDLLRSLREREELIQGVACFRLYQ